MQNIVHRQSCRICGNTKLTEILDFGPMYLQGLFVKKGDYAPQRKVPLTLVRCDTEKNENGCGLVQLNKTVSPDILYSNYWYESGVNLTMKRHLEYIVNMATSFNTLYSTVLDIGANDGTLLSFYPESIIKYGIDPSNIIDKITNPHIQKIKTTYPSIELKEKKFDIITSIAMLYDIENPSYFVSEVYNNLDENGIWVFEMSYLPSMIKANAFDTICNEHLEYYSLSVLEYLLEKNNMRLVYAELNDINGGSILCVATKNSSKIKVRNPNYIRKLKIDEFDMKLDTNDPYYAFSAKTWVIIFELKRLISSIIESGKTIHLYGASTKGNTLLQLLDVDNSIIPYAAERNPAKWGAKTLGTNIEIISEAESRAMKPDFYLVMPWHFKEEILERERLNIQNNTKFIFPLPEVQIYPIQEN